MRRTFIVLGWLLAFTLVALASMPWWLGTALDLAGKRYGLTLGRYERLGYSRFALADVRWQRDNVEVRARRIEGEMPLRWAWHRSRGSTPGPWIVSGWRVQVTRSTKTTSPASPKGWVPLRARLAWISEGLRRWLPPTTLTEGEVRWPTDSLTIARAAWQSGGLRTEDIAFGSLRGNAVVDWPRGGDLAVTVLPVEEKSWEARATSRGADAEGSLRLWDQSATFQARFSESGGWLPQEGRLLAKAWTVPASRVRLAPAYASVTGSTTMDWHGDRLAIELDAKAAPISGGGAPPLTAVIRANGDKEAVRVERLELDAPGVSARLARPVVVERTGLLQSAESTFTVAIELDKQPWFAAKGRVTGEVKVTRNPDGKPQFDARLSGEKLSGQGWTIPSLRMAGQLLWPWLDLAEGEIRWSERDALAVRGRYDIKGRTLANASTHGRVPRVVLAAWLPETLAFDAATIEAEASGRWPELAHQGKLSIEKISFPPVNPTALSLDWRGVGRDLEDVNGMLSAGATEIGFSGKFAGDLIELRGLRVVREAIEQLSSKSSATIRWRPVASIQNLNLDGPGGTLAGKLESGETGVVEISAREISPALWSDFVPVAGPAWKLHSLTLEGKWNRGPLMFTAEGNGTINLSNDRQADVTLSARGDGKGVHLEKVSVSIGEEPVLKATAAVPVSLTMAPRWAMTFDPAADFRLDAETEKSPAFWTRLGELTGLRLEDPEIKLNLLGTWRTPRGQAIVRVARVGLPAKAGSTAWPALEAINAELFGDGRSVTLKSLSARIAGQPVQAEARLPLPIELGGNSKEKILDWLQSKIEARVRIPDVDLAAVSSFAPAWIGPTGRASLDFAVKPAAQFEGTIRVRDAMSRPLGPLGVLQSIVADLEFKGRRLEIQRLEGRTGGQAVTLAGWAELTPREGLKLEISLKGTNLPFVRQTGLLIRGDLDLKLATPSPGVTKVSGKARLRDSLFLTDVRAYIPQGGARSAPARRPPYFSIEAPPFAGWLLDVEVEGDRFLRLRTPVFSGLASARFRLDGTLLEPRAIGEAVVEEGTVTLPFATFRVQQGDVRLAPSSPYDPRISIVATSRRFGYDIQMELSGSAASPTLQFSSSPPLSSEQVLLMVMAGETPQSEVVYSGSQRAVRLGAYLGQALLGQIGADPEKAERFSLSVGERVSREGRETYSFEYPLNDRFSLVGEYDEFDDYNVGVKWRALIDRRKEKGKP